MRTNNMNDLTIEGPVFYGEEDENIFFQCINNLSGFKEVVGAGTALTISFHSCNAEKVKEQIEVLCRRWDTKICT